MFTKRRAANIECKTISSFNASRQAAYRQPIVALIIGSAVMLGITGCGQKGELYLADTSSQTIINGSDEPASEVLDSTSHPQDGAFAGLDDDDYQKSRYLKQKQMLQDVNEDPNDY